MSHKVLPSWRIGSASVIVRPRLVVLAIILSAVMLCLTIAHMVRPGEELGFGQIAASVFGLVNDPQAQLVVWEFRAPRAVAAVAVGLALGASGALTQTMTRNPLASPDLLGIMSGAALGVVATVMLTAGFSGGATGVLATVGVPTGAFVMGSAAAMLVVLLTHDLGLASSRVIVVGLGITGLCSALTSWILTLGDVFISGQAVTWLIGSLNGKDWQTLALPGSAIALGLLAVAILARRLRPLVFADETTIALGASAVRGRLLVIGLATWLAVSATALAGPVAFVALAAPHLAKLLSRQATPPVATGGMLGATLVLFADMICTQLLPVPLPVGVGTAAIGAPYLILLLLRRKAI